MTLDTEWDIYTNLSETAVHTEADHPHEHDIRCFAYDACLLDPLEGMASEVVAVHCAEYVLAERDAHDSYRVNGGRG